MTACHRQIYNAAGVVRRNTLYDPFGNVLTTGGTSASVYGYTGEQTDATGLVYLRARYYDAGQGRFTTRDTWEGIPFEGQSLNRFAYVANNPIIFTDHSGQQYGQTLAIVCEQNPYVCYTAVSAAIAALAPEAIVAVAFVGSALTTGVVIYLIITYPADPTLCERVSQSITLGNGVHPRCVPVPPSIAAQATPMPFTGDPKVWEQRLAQQQAEPAPNVQRPPAPEPAPEPRTDLYVPPLPIPTCTQTPDGRNLRTYSRTIDRAVNNPKNYTLRPTEEGLSTFSDVVDAQYVLKALDESRLVRIPSNSPIASKLGLSWVKTQGRTGDPLLDANHWELQSLTQLGRPDYELWWNNHIAPALAIEAPS